MTKEEAEQNAKWQAEQKESAAKTERDKDQACAVFDDEFGYGWTYHPGRVRDVVCRLVRMLDRSQEVARQEQANNENHLKRISESEADAGALKRENRRLANMLRHMCATAESNKTAWYMTGDIYSWFTRERHATPAATPAAMTPDEQRVRDAEIANLKRFAVLSFKPVEYESAAGGFKPTEQSKKDAVEFVRLRDAIKHSLATGNPAEPEPIRLTAANGPQWEELPAIEPESSTPAASPTAEEFARLEASRAAWDAFPKQFAGCASQYFQALEKAVRQGRGPQPVVKVGTPREAITAVWDALAAMRNLRVAELALTVADRESFDNTLRVAWADRPKAAQAHATLSAGGQRVVEGKTETVNLDFSGRFETLKDLLAPLWPFRGGQGELQVTIAVSLKFPDPPPTDDPALDAFRTALMNAGQGQMEVRLVPVRPRKTGGA